MTTTQQLQKMIDRLDEEFYKENGYYQANTEPYTFAMRVAKVAFAMGIGKMNGAQKPTNDNPYNIDYKRQTKLFDDEKN